MTVSAQIYNFCSYRYDRLLTSWCWNIHWWRKECESFACYVFRLMMISWNCSVFMSHKVIQAQETNLNWLVNSNGKLIWHEKRCYAMTATTELKMERKINQISLWTEIKTFRIITQQNRTKGNRQRIFFLLNSAKVWKCWLRLGKTELDFDDGYLENSHSDRFGLASFQTVTR